MRLNIFGVSVVLAPLLILGEVSSNEAFAATVPVVQDPCTFRTSVKPHKISITCGLKAITDIQWFAWGGKEASGEGTLILYQCDADARCTTIAKHTVITLSDMGECYRFNKLAYTRIGWIERGQPFGEGVYLTPCA
jgi:hypothetical protein